MESTKKIHGNTKYILLMKKGYKLWKILKINICIKNNGHVNIVKNVPFKK